MEDKRAKAVEGGKFHLSPKKKAEQGKRCKNNWEISGPDQEIRRNVGEEAEKIFPKMGKRS